MSKEIRCHMISDIVRQKNLHFTKYVKQYAHECKFLYVIMVTFIGCHLVEVQ